MSSGKINVKNLSFRYITSKENILKDISFSVEKNECILIVGPSGCGKSTLALCLTGIIPKVIDGDFNGQVYLNGVDNTEKEMYQICKEIGIQFQEIEKQFSMLDVEDEIAFGLENLNFSQEDIKKRVVDSLKTVDLSKKINSKLKKLSGGEKQKVGIASVLAMDPDILIFDSLFSHLDQKSSKTVSILLEKLKRDLGKTIIIFEYKTENILHIVDKIGIMNDKGELECFGKPDQIIEDIGIDSLIKKGIWLPQLLEIIKIKDKNKFVSFPDINIDQFNLIEKYELKSVLLNDYSESSSHTDLFSLRSEVQIHINNLSYHYPDGYKALDNISISINKGDMFAICGSNGAGKTTLAKQICKILVPQKKTVFIDGIDITDIKTEDIFKKIGYVFQNPDHQFIERNVYDELAYGLRIKNFNEKDVRIQVNELISNLDLVGLENENPFRLSQGQKRRLSIGTMLIIEPEIAIFDEPTFGQDRINTYKIMNILKKLNEKGITIILITHDSHLVSEYVRNISILKDGRTQFFGTVDNLFKNTIFDEDTFIKPTTINLLEKINYEMPVFPFQIKHVNLEQKCK